MNPDQIKISKYPVLIVEDKKENQILLQTICSRLGLKTLVANNGKEGLDIVSKERISIYIVDLMLPVMDGKTFVIELKKIEPDAIIIIQSALDSSNTIIDIMRLGVYDYILKPIDIDLFKIVLGRSLEYKYLKDIEKEMLLNENIKLRGQLEWLNYKETLRLTGKDSYQKNSIFNLTTSLSQGAGIGATISIIDIIDSCLMEKTHPNENEYLIDKELVDTLIQNNDLSRRMIFGLGEVVRLMEEEFVLKEHSTKKIVDDLPEILEGFIPYLKNKNITLSFPAPISEVMVDIDREKFVLVIEEIMINAYKYSNPNTNISIFANLSGTYFCLTVKNDMESDIYGGIPPEKEKLVLEPFYRIHPPVEDIVELEKFSIGLGLTVVDFIINKHSGMFFIHNAIDHTGVNSGNCILAEVFIPIKIKRGSN